MFNNIGTDIVLAAQLLQQGNLVAIPTETVYGLAANALDENAVKKIYEAKQRPAVNPLIIHLADASQVEEFVEYIPAVAHRLIERFCPGPLTVVLPRKNIIPDIVTAGKDTVAIRIPAHPVAQQLLRLARLPLAAPSANPSGYISPTSAVHVLTTLGGRVSYILDGGDCNAGIESTIVGFDNEVPVIYRQGVITAGDIESVAGVVKQYAGSALLAPGMSRSHYSPVTPVIATRDVEETLHKYNDLRLGLLTYGTYAPEIPTHDQELLCVNDEWHIAARNLYGAMHRLDGRNYDLIIARLFPSGGIGSALNDRLERAAAK
jgi:L-threonylcarbamoyladenylate synthase